MLGSLSVTVLSENSVGENGFTAEHGISFWIKADGYRILLDTGQGKVFAKHARKLGIRLSSAEAVVMSHGHYDHTGGLGTVLNRAKKAELYLHPEALRRKYSCKPGEKIREIGISSANIQQILSHQGDLVRWTRTPMKIAAGVYVTGEIPRHTAFEDVGGSFYLDEKATVPDPVLDDQALYFETRRGAVVLLGCGHAGVVNTLSYVVRLMRKKKIYAVMGGMHLLNSGEERLRATADAFEKFKIERLMPCHCTGQNAVAYFRSRFGERISLCGAGSRFEF